MDEPTRTLVRCTGGQVQIIREGREEIETQWLDVSFVDLFGFVCERCAITVQVRQNS